MSHDDFQPPDPPTSEQEHDEKERLSLIYEGKWAEVCFAIDELEWYVSRKTDLSRQCDHGSPRIWADVMAEDIKDLRKAIDEARR